MTNRQVVWTVLVGLAAGLAGGALAARLLIRTPSVHESDPKRAGVVVASEFHLVDEEGKDRWVLALSKGGEPSITFINRASWAPMAMGINRDGLPYFNMVLEPSKGGGPSLVLMDSQMKARALLGLSEDGDPSLSMWDKQGRKRTLSPDFPGRWPPPD